MSKEPKTIKTTAWALGNPKTVAMMMFTIPMVLSLVAGVPNIFPDQLGGIFSTVTVDTDPRNMLRKDHPFLLAHAENQERFDLQDAIVLGVVNESDANGVFNPDTLGKVHAITEVAKGLKGVVVHNIFAPSTVDSIEGQGGGSVTFDWLMPEPPKSQEEALAIRDKAMRIPFLKDTLISSDGQALAVYIPLEDKNEAYEIAEILRAEIREMKGNGDKFHLAGLPIAEDQFGLEMFIQMLISPPSAMVAIFFLMLFFFRRLSVVMAPMLVAMAAAMGTTALLLVTGQTVHIMSSMIPIFIFPIAVLDGVHILSEFFDRYPESDGDRKKTVKEIMSHLFQPMLFTSLTTAVGFAALALTPIPPIRVFGIFVAIGVLMAWFFTVTFIPAYIMMLSPERLEGFGRKIEAKKKKEEDRGPLAFIGRMRKGHAIAILLGSCGLVVISVLGIMKITVNDNPTRWFETYHEIRIADTAMNKHFGGTYDAYLNFIYKSDPYAPDTYAEALKKRAAAESAAVAAVFAELEEAIGKQEVEDPLDRIDALDKLARERRLADKDAARRVAWALANDFLAEQFEIADGMAEESDESEESAPDTAAPEVADPAAAAPETATPDAVATLTLATKERAAALAGSYQELGKLVDSVAGTKPADSAAFLTALRAKLGDTGGLSSTTLSGVIDRHELTDQVFKRPEVLAYLDKLQKKFASHPKVGKSTSLAEIVKVVHRDLLSGTEKDYRIPDTSEVVGQTLTQFQSSHRKDDLWHFVTSDYEHALVWFQLKGGDNEDMEELVDDVTAYIEANPAPIEVEEPSWFGLTYINMVWQDILVGGMMNALYGSFVVVLCMMMLLFRSLLWGLLSMVPLSLSVGLIYGVLGIVGKQYDAPIAILSSLALGLTVDYAIHFLARYRELRDLHGNCQDAQREVFKEPARAIVRNVIVVGVGFLPLLLAKLVPYQTIGLLVSILLFSAGVISLLVLPALLQVLDPVLFREKAAKAD